MILKEIIEIVFLMAGTISAIFLFEMIRKKRIYIIDDSEVDMQIYKHMLKDAHCKLIHRKTVQGLPIEFAIRKPDGVVCDYYLQDSVCGDKVYQFCKRNGINFIMVTARDGMIKGVPPSVVIKKDPDHKHIKSIQDFIDGIAA